MANVLNADKQIAVIGALAEGSGTRSILESVPVKEEFHGETVREGVVEVLIWRDAQKQIESYAGTHETDDLKKPKRHAAVLRIPAVVPPQTAVRSAIVQELRDAQA